MTGCGSSGAKPGVWSANASPIPSTAAAGDSADPGSSAGAGRSAGPDQGGRQAPGQELTFAFAGDVHFFERTAPLLNNPKTAFGSIASTLSGADYTVVNLETAITSRGTAESKTFHFRTSSTAFSALRSAGVDAVTLANNHVLDYGQVGFTDTLAAAEQAKFPYFGVGRDTLAAHTPMIADVKGVKVAFLGFSQVHELASTWAATDTRPGIAMAFDVPAAVAAVKAARQQADLVVVFNHWGEESNQCPIAEQKSFAKSIADAGADLIIGSHAHTLQGDGYLGKTYVAYGMGNFLWYSASRSTDTGVLRVTVQGRSVTKHELVPARVSSTTGQPVPLTGSEATQLTQRYAGLRKCAGLADQAS